MAANSRDNKLLKWGAGEILHAKATFELKFRKGEKKYKIIGIKPPFVI